MTTQPIQNTDNKTKKILLAPFGALALAGAAFILIKKGLGDKAKANIAGKALRKGKVSSSILLMQLKQIPVSQN